MELQVQERSSYLANSLLQFLDGTSFAGDEEVITLINGAQRSGQEMLLTDPGRDFTQQIQGFASRVTNETQF